MKISYCLILYGAYSLIPYRAVSVRRLHDRGRSAWFLLWNLLPVVGTLIVTITYIFPSKYEENNYGLPPKAND